MRLLRTRRLVQLSLVLALSSCLTGNITGKAAQQLVKTHHAVLVDVRTPAEYAMDHLDGAVNVPLGELEARLADFPARKDQDVIVYCRSGHRSARAAAVLRDAGFTEVHDLGTILNWKSE